MRFRYLSITLILLLIICQKSYATKPKQMGIGIRAGVYNDVTRFQDDDDVEYITSDLDDDGDEQPSRFPLFIQFEEDLLYSWVNTTWYVDINLSTKSDMSPALVKGLNYDDLMEWNKDSSGNDQSFSINSAETKIDYFIFKYPQFSNLINSISNPSLSADYNLATITAGKMWGIFIPIGNHNRIFSFSLGWGIAYYYGNYQINICNPYFVENKGNGLCKNKTEIYSAHVSNFGLSGTYDLALYTYVGETFEITVGNASQVASYPILEKNYNKVLYPRFAIMYRDDIRFVWHF